METIEFAGRKFQCEKLDAEHFKTGVCAFKMVDEEGDTQWFVVTPFSMAENNKEIKTPNDGRLCAVSPDRTSALMVASSISIAVELASHKGAIMIQVAKGRGFDIDAIQREVGKLIAEGKSMGEIREIMKPRMAEFKKDKKEDKPDTGSADDDKEGAW